MNEENKLYHRENRYELMISCHVDEINESRLDEIKEDIENAIRDRGLGDFCEMQKFKDPISFIICFDTDQPEALHELLKNELFELYQELYDSSAIMINTSKGNQNGGIVNAHI